MAAEIPNLVKRKKIYYFRCRIPSILTYTVEEVCNFCGFNSVNYFRRQFKAKYGITPGKYCALGK